MQTVILMEDTDLDLRKLEPGDMHNRTIPI